MAAPGGSADAVRDLRVGDGHGGIGKRRIGSFASPTYVTHPPGFPHHLYVVEPGGTVRVLHNGNLRRPAVPGHTRRVSTGGERGLLSIAFDPHYRRNRLLYAYYTNRAGNIEIDEFRAPTNGDASEGSRRKVIVIRHPRFANHNGGQLQFGPDDRLYIGTGDGGGAGDPRENAQDKGSLLGKLLRIDPHRHGSRPYKAPRGNPYVGRAGKNEIYARGLRNPYRFAFDRGRIVLGDVGQYRWEEVDYETRRACAAPTSAGTVSRATTASTTRATTRPGEHVTTRGRSSSTSTPPETAGRGSCAIIGGYVVRSRRLRSLRGRYLYADFYSGRLRSFVARRGHGRRDRALGVRVPHPSSFGKGRGRTNLRRLPGWPCVQARAQVAGPVERDSAGHWGVKSARDGRRDRERDANRHGIARRCPGH